MTLKFSECHYVVETCWNVTCLAVHWFLLSLSYDITGLQYPAPFFPRKITILELYLEAFI